MTATAVAIVNYNTRVHLQACLATVRAAQPDEIVVVDNGSTDGSVEMVRADDPDVLVVANTSNPGYGAAANQALARCASPYVLLINSDTLLQPEALQALATYFDLHPRVAITGPRIVNPDGTLQVSCFQFPSPLNTLVRESSLTRLIGRIPFLRNLYLQTWSHDRPRAVPWVLGAALMLRQEAMQAIGGFDESFFMYSEEVDLCYRAAAAGWQVHFAPVTEIVHVGGASTVQQRATMVAQLYASRLQFYRYHYSALRLAQYRLVMAALMLRNLLLGRLQLRHASHPEQRARIVEDLAVWRRILRMQWQGSGPGGMSPRPSTTQQELD